MTSALADSRGYAGTLVVGLGGAVAMVVGVSRPWVTATAGVAGLPSVKASVDGADVAPLAAALGFVLLASFGAVIATRSWVRRGVGALIVVCSGVVLMEAAVAGGATDLLESSLSARGWSGGDYDVGVAAWRWVVVVSAALCLSAGIAVIRYAISWPTMGSRYDAPAAAEQPRQSSGAWSEADVWKAIDRGHDPTQTP